MTTIDIGQHGYMFSIKSFQRYCQYVNNNGRAMPIIVMVMRTLKRRSTAFCRRHDKYVRYLSKRLMTLLIILYQNPPTNQINLPQLIRSHKKLLNPPTIR